MNTYETYVSIETARLLKKAGYKWATPTAYDSEGKLVTLSASDWNSQVHGVMSAPTLAVAQKWLRERSGYEVEVHRAGERYIGWVLKHNDGYICQDTPFYDTYETAFEYAIQMALNLIIEQL